MTRRERREESGAKIFRLVIEIPIKSPFFQRRRHLTDFGTKSYLADFFSHRFHFTSSPIPRSQVPFGSATTGQGEGLLPWGGGFRPQKAGPAPREDRYLRVYREGTEPDEAAGPRGPAPSPGFPARPARGGHGAGGGAEEGAGRGGGRKGRRFTTGALWCGSGSEGRAWRRRRRELWSRESKQRAWRGGGKAAGSECERRWSWLSR